MALRVPPERVVAYIESLPPLLALGSVKLRIAAVTGRRRAVGEVVPARLDSWKELAGLRNRALLLIQAGGLTPPEVAGIDREDLRFGDRELVLSVRAGETAVERSGQVVRLLHILRFALGSDADGRVPD